MCCAHFAVTAGAAELPASARFIAAAYDEAGMLTDCKIYENETKAYEQELDMTNAKSVKTFLWDMETLQPLTRDTAYDEPKSDTLVVYFSFTDNTKTLAENIIRLTDADSWRIEASEPYGEENLNYYDQSTRCYIEQYNTPNVRPAFNGSITNLADYETVILGYPIWYGKEPRIILTFLDTYKDDLNGKTIIPFCTSGGSGISTSAVKAAVPESIVKNGFRGTASMSDAQIRTQLKNNGYIFKEEN